MVVWHLPWKKVLNSRGKAAGANLYLLFSFMLTISLETQETQGK